MLRMYRILTPSRKVGLYLIFRHGVYIYESVKFGQLGRWNLLEIFVTDDFLLRENSDYISDRAE